jgi:hypothetical protein
VALTSNSLANKSSGNTVQTHPYSHPRHVEIVKHTLDVFDIDVEAILNGSIALTAKLCCDLNLRRYQEFKGKVQKIGW